MSAAALATSAALSTEIPTSAKGMAGASLIPSPIRQPSRPTAEAGGNHAQICCGVTRQNSTLQPFCRSKGPAAQRRLFCSGSAPVRGQSPVRKRLRRRADLFVVFLLALLRTVIRWFSLAPPARPRLRLSAGQERLRCRQRRDPSRLLVRPSPDRGSARLATPSSRKPCALH